MSRRIFVFLALLFATATPQIAGAQPTASTFEELRAQQKPGRMVRLFDTKGRQTVGRIRDITRSEIVLDVKDFEGTPRPQRFPESDVREIREKRSHWLGPVIGLVAGVVISNRLCAWDGECGNGSRMNAAATRRASGWRDDPRVSPMHVSGPLMLAALAGGPALGRLFDRPGLERFLYRAPEPRSVE